MKGTLVLVLGVGLVASWLRLYQIGQTQPLTLDIARDLIIMKQIASEGRLPLVGPTTSIGEIPIGPGYYYLMAPWLKIANFDPVVLPYAMALMNSLGIMLLFFITRSLLNQKVALIAMIGYGLSWGVVYEARLGWNPSLIPMVSMIFFYLLAKIYVSGRDKLIVPAWILIVVGWQFHATAVVALIPLLFVIGNRLKYSKDRQVVLLSTLIGLGLLGLGLGPSFVAYQNWAELFNQQAIVSGTQIADKAVKGIGYSLGFRGPSPYTYIIFFLWTIGWFKLVKLRHSQPIYRCLTITYFFCLGGVSLLPGKIYTHYVAFLFPLAWMMTGVMIVAVSDRYKIKLSWSGAMMVIVFMGLGWPQYSFNQPQSWQLDDYKQVAQDILGDAQDQSFTIGAIQADGDYLGLGYRYYLDLIRPGFLNNKVNPQEVEITYIISDYPLINEQSGKVTKEWNYRQLKWLYRLEK